ncbi:hypothetical protein BsWGS_23970 [Bradybaena similaris]
MGSGSSKAKSVAAREAADFSPRKPVANVNKPEPASMTTESATINSVNNNKVVVEKQDREPASPSKQWFHGNKHKRVDEDTPIGGYSYNNDSPSALQFEDDSDYNDDINKILEIPVADKSKQGENKEKKMKQAHGDKIIGTDRMVDVRSRKEPEYTEAPLPETYAQRMQRKQYTLQQNLLLRDREMVRSAPDWRHESDEEDVSRESSQTGFDASKFRAVNRGRGFKQDVTTSTSEGFKAQHYLPSAAAHDFDDFEVKPREDVSVTKHLPQYNQSELDLMRQLEDDLL